MCSSKISGLGVHFRKPQDYLEEVIFGDRLGLSQVLVNLVNNALHAIEECDDKWLAIQVSPRQNFWEIAVLDSGKGVSDDNKGSIFELFYTTKPTGKGTGLGLVISQEIMKKHQGKVMLDETSPQTKFVMLVPKVTMDKKGVG